MLRCVAQTAHRICNTIPIQSSVNSISPISSTSSIFNSIWNQQIRCAGRLGGAKSKRKSQMPPTRKQSGVMGTRMEFYWPKHSARKRIPLWENSRLHCIYDARLKRWMTMWYRRGIQVFQTFNAKQRSENFERSRMKAILLHQQLKHGHKLGSPGPELGRGGIRGVYYDTKERSWGARWVEAGLTRHRLYPVTEYGFHNAYKHAAKERLTNMSRNYCFQFHRSRTVGYRKKLGTTKT